MKKIWSVLSLATIFNEGVYLSAMECKGEAKEASFVFPERIDSSVRDLIQCAFSPDLDQKIRGFRNAGTLTGETFTWRTGKQFKKTVIKERTMLIKGGAPVLTTINEIENEILGRVLEPRNEEILKEIFGEEVESDLAFRERVAKLLKVDGEKEKAYVTEFLKESERDLKNSIFALRNVLYRVRNLAVGDYLLMAFKFVCNTLMDNKHFCEYPIFLRDEEDGEVELVWMLDFEVSTYEKESNLFEKVLNSPCLDYEFGRDSPPSLKGKVQMKKLNCLRSLAFDLARFLAVSLILWYHNDPKADLTQLVMGK